MKFDHIIAEDPEILDALNKIRVVYCEPGRKAKVIEIGTELPDLQAAVGGFIETYYGLDDRNSVIVCNDEGKLIGMNPCRAVYGDDGKIADIIFGPFFICDCSTEEFKSLDDSRADKYLEQFKYPEIYYRKGDEIKAVRYDPKKNLAVER